MANLVFVRGATPVGAMCSLLALLSGCGSDAESVGSERAALVAICAESVESVPDGVWLCGAGRTVECDAHPGTASPAAIYVLSNEGCTDRQLLVDEGPFTLGEHEIVVRERVDAAGSTAPVLREVCRSPLTVVDSAPPEAHPRHTTLWPPNHKLHTLSAQACAGVLDACDPRVAVSFTSAASDEPADATGDGAFEPDIVFTSRESVSLRAERQGGGNGRVYTLSWLARDAAGNELAGTCAVEVPHDQSGRATISEAPAYSLPAPGLP